MYSKTTSICELRFVCDQKLGFIASTGCGLFSVSTILKLQRRNKKSSLPLWCKREIQELQKKKKMFTLDKRETEAANVDMLSLTFGEPK